MSISGLGTVLGTIGQVGNVISTAQGLFGPKSSSTQTRYINLAGSAVQDQSELAEEQADLAREQWEIYRRDFLPLERERAEEARRDLGLFRPLKEAAVREGLSDLRRTAPLESRLYREALEGIEPDIMGVKGRASADVAQSFEKVREKALSRQREQGSQPARLSYLNRITDIEQASAEAAARTLAGRAERDRADTLSRNILTSTLSGVDGIPNIPASALSPADADRLAIAAANRALTLYGSAGQGLSRSVLDISRVLDAGEDLKGFTGGIIPPRSIDFVNFSIGSGGLFRTP